MDKKKKEMYTISVVLTSKQSVRLMDMYLYEVGYLELPDDAVIKAVQKPDLKKIKTFVKLLGGSVNILDKWFVESYQ
jgi:hypothetical protein